MWTQQFIELFIMADLPPRVVEELGITVIPINIHFGTEVYRDGIDITTEEFYEKLDGSTNFPTTSAPSPGVFGETYDKIFKRTRKNTLDDSYRSLFSHRSI